ncbi:MAG: hypothetical protein AB1632_13965 [Nitrospirota bacterium]
MRKKMILGLIISAFFISGCSIKTPEIHGVVLDAETKQPVEGAWVTATLGIKTKTVGGDSYTYLSVDEPHTRTDKSGKFIIPSKSFKKPSFPAGFGTDVETFGVSAHTVDWRGGGEEIKDSIGKNKIELTLYIDRAEKGDKKKIDAYLRDGVTKERALEIIEQEYFSSLQALYNYCLTGRLAVEIPAVEGGCDEWELDYAIKKHEWYLERISYGGEHAGGTLKQLGYLYKKKSDYAKAVEVFKKTLDYDKKRNIRFRRGEVETQIKELEQLLKEKQN